MSVTVSSTSTSSNITSANGTVTLGDYVASSGDYLTYTTTTTPFLNSQSYEPYYGVTVQVHVVHLEDNKVVRKKTVTFQPENMTEFKKEFPDDVIILTECDLAEVK